MDKKLQKKARKFGALSNNNFVYKVGSPYVANFLETYITVWYTKTTDTAGSGSYTTLGVPAVHYSTDEQVVGTWIDGKTLYQKTCIYGSVSGASASLSLDIANVDYISLCTEGSSVNGVCPIPYVTGNNNNNNIGGYFDIAVNNTNFAIRIGSGMVGNVNSVILTVVYTKTTD